MCSVPYSDAHLQQSIHLRDIPTHGTQLIQKPVPILRRQFTQAFPCSYCMSIQHIILVELKSLFHPTCHSCVNQRFIRNHSMFTYMYCILICIKDIWVKHSVHLEHQKQITSLHVDMVHVYLVQSLPCRASVGREGKGQK